MTVSFGYCISAQIITDQDPEFHYLRVKSKEPSLTDDQMKRIIGVANPFWPYLVEIESLGNNFLTRIDTHRTNQQSKTMKNTQKGG